MRKRNWIWLSCGNISSKYSGEIFSFQSCKIWSGAQNWGPDWEKLTMDNIRLRVIIFCWLEPIGLVLSYNGIEIRNLFQVGFQQRKSNLSNHFLQVTLPGWPSVLLSSPSSLSLQCLSILPEQRYWKSLPDWASLEVRSMSGKGKFVWNVFGVQTAVKEAGAGGQACWK